jgi:hypothetical protein
MEKAHSAAVRGRRSRSLTEEQRGRLEKFRREQRNWSWPMVLTAMGSWPERPFRLQTLLRAAAGGAVSEKNHHFIVRWLDAHLPGQPLPQDHKMRAAADDSLETEETPQNAPQDETTKRGSR